MDGRKLGRARIAILAVCTFTDAAKGRRKPYLEKLALLCSFVRRRRRRFTLPLFLSPVSPTRIFPGSIIPFPTEAEGQSTDVRTRTLGRADRHASLYNINQMPIDRSVGRDDRFGLAG